jgi:DNA-binding winged helix-turn-helix (wHTH) protein/Tfp pilus assembly protein PilF
VAGGDVLAFGPFLFDPETKRLSKDGEPIALGARQGELLNLFAARAGQILSKDLLIAAAWRDVAVTDNSLEQAISGLRRVLAQASGEACIETLARRGYRFSAVVTRVPRRETAEALDPLLAPHRAWIEGRAALETLKHDQIVQARTVFERVLDQAPDQAPAHVGFANACAMQFEMTRSDRTPDVDALSAALRHATEACRIDPGYAEAWATLGFVLDRAGNRTDALAALRRAVGLEPDNWRHHLRLAYTSWGEERLGGARRTLALLPGFPLAHWLAATVYVARHALSEAERELDAGIAGQVADKPAFRFSGIALHWLLGLVHLARGDTARALDAFERELSHETSGHLYARECCANTWYAIGALRLRQQNRADAAAAFREALSRVSNHGMARLVLAVLDTAGVPPDSRETNGAPHSASGAEPLPVEAAMYRAVRLVLAGSREEAAHTVAEALTRAPAGSAGWLLPVEPVIFVTSDSGVWAAALSCLRNRAA